MFEESLDVPPEQLGARLNQGSHGAELVQAINEFAQTNELAVIPKRMKEGLNLILRRAKWDTHSLGPIVGYLEARETEAEALRMIFGAIQGGVRTPAAGCLCLITGSMGGSHMEKKKLQ